MRRRLATAMGIGVVSVCAVVVMTGCSSGPSKGEQLTNAKVDASMLGYQIATWFVDHTEVPDITLKEGMYEVGGESATYWLLDPFPATLKGAVLTTDVNSATDWCVTVANSDGSLAVSYSALGGLEEGTCD